MSTICPCFLMRQLQTPADSYSETLQEAFDKTILLEDDDPLQSLPDVAAPRARIGFGAPSFSSKTGNGKNQSPGTGGSGGTGETADTNATPKGAPKPSAKPQKIRNLRVPCPDNDDGDGDDDPLLYRCHCLFGFS